jgi:hypothetical protein
MNGERAAVARRPPGLNLASAGQCTRLRALPPRPELLRPVEPARLRDAVPVLRVDAAFVVRPADFAPFERGAAFFAVREAGAFVVREPADFAVREAEAFVVREPVDLAVREPAAFVPREAVLFARLAVADLARVELAAFRVPLAALLREEVAALRVPVAALPREDVAVFRVEVPAAFRVEEAAALPRPPALARPPLAAAAVRPAAPRAVLPDALRVPLADFARVPFEDEAVLLLRVLLEARRAGARRRFGVSSVGCSIAASAPFSAGVPFCSVSSLMRLSSVMWFWSPSAGRSIGCRR